MPIRIKQARHRKSDRCSSLDPYRLGDSAGFAVSEVAFPVLANFYPFAFTAFGAARRTHGGHARSLVTHAAPPVIAEVEARVEIGCSAMLAGRFRCARVRVRGLGSVGIAGALRRAGRGGRRAVRMPFGKELGHLLRFALLHAP